MGVWSGSGSVAEILTVREEPAGTVWFSMAAMDGGLSLGSVTVRVKVSVSVSSPEEAVMVRLVTTGATSGPGENSRVAVPSPVEVSVA